MMRGALVVVLPCLLLVGCSTRPIAGPPLHRQTLASNAATFDRYVVERTEFLQKSGVVKDRQEAEAKARSDAANRFGERTPEYKTSWTWGAGPRPLTLAELDETLDQMAKSKSRP